VKFDSVIPLYLPFYLHSETLTTSFPSVSAKIHILLLFSSLKLKPHPLWWPLAGDSGAPVGQVNCEHLLVLLLVWCSYFFILICSSFFYVLKVVEEPVTP
jgi:hypothetical protein